MRREEEANPLFEKGGRGEKRRAEGESSAPRRGRKWSRLSTSLFTPSSAPGLKEAEPPLALPESGARDGPCPGRDEARRKTCIDNPKCIRGRPPNELVAKNTIDSREKSDRPRLALQGESRERRHQLSASHRITFWKKLATQGKPESAV